MIQMHDADENGHEIDNMLNDENAETDMSLTNASIQIEKIDEN